jgi:pimeloyl-ACP methyl ester carboxylesterase
VVKLDIEKFAWIGDAILQKPVSGIVVNFHGLGYAQMKQTPDVEELELAAAGALNVFPYYGPWSWMNRETRSSMDVLIDSVYEQFGLDGNVPLILRGGSMGGSSALVYTRYAKRPVTACAVNCPVADIPFHFTERVDLPRTLHHAFGHYAEPLQQVMEEHSPVHLAGSLPDISYLIVHGDSDQSVNKERHSDVLVQKMRERGLQVEYIEVPGMGHCTFTDYSIYRRLMDFVISILAGQES